MIGPIAKIPVDYDQVSVLRPDSVTSVCPDRGQDYVPLYSVNRKWVRGFKSSMYVRSFGIDERHQLKEIWKVQDAGYRPNRAHPVIAVDPQSRKSTLIFTAVGRDEVPGSSTLFMIDGATGEVRQKQKFLGQVRYSMPLLVDDLVLVPTTDRGLQVFKVENFETPRWPWEVRP
jgi:hypothetical protein